MKFSIKDFFSRCDQIRRKLRIWSHLLKKSLMEKFIFCVGKIVKSNTQIFSFFPDYTHCVRSVRIRSYSVPHFLALGLDTERYGVSLFI